MNWSVYFMLLYYMIINIFFSVRIIFLFSPEDKIKAMEKSVNELIEESCFAASRGENQVVILVISIY